MAKIKLVTITVRRLKCERCGHVWAPKIKDVRICPKCKSARFDTPPMKRSA